MMATPDLLSPDAGRSAAARIDAMSRLYYLSRAIHVAAELGIADHLADEPVAATDLAARTGLHAQALLRLVRFLSAYGIFAEPAPGRVRNTALSAVLRDDHPQSVRASLRRIVPAWWSAVGHLEHTVRTGETGFAHVHGTAFFPFLRANPDIQRRFDEGMAAISDLDDAAIAGAYDFTRFGRIVDVGGGRGGLLAQILLRAPEANGVLFDQPQVLETATHPDEAGIEGRVEKVAGDFFESVPAGADCYVIKGVLHDFDDAQCIRILGNCRAAMKDDGRLLIANRDLPASVVAPSPNLTMDIQMMAIVGGRERSERDWSEIFRRSGLTPGRRVETDVGFTLTEGRPS